MLKIFRDNLKYLSWILWTFVAIFILYIFADFGGGISNTGGRGSGYAARVGDQTVSMAEFKSENQALESQYRQMYGERFTPEFAKQMKLPVVALDRIIGKKILLVEADKMGLGTSDAELRQAILAVPAFKDEHGEFIGDSEYDRLLRDNGRVPEVFERDLREQLTIQKLTLAMKETVQVPDAEVEASYRAQSDKAKIRFVVLPAGRFQANVPAPQPADVKTYFDAHREEFRLPEQRVIDYVLVDSGKVMQTTAVSDADAKAYYDGHTSEFVQEEQVRARHILLQVNDKRTEAQAMTEAQAIKARLQKGEDFAKIAAEKSEDPGSKAQGGDLGFFGRGRMIKEFEDAAFGAKPGEIVGPVKTSFGVHILKIEEHRPGGQRSFEDSKAAILNRLRSERAQTNAESKAREIHDRLAKESDLDLTKLRAGVGADIAVASVETTTPFGRDEPVPGIGRGTPFSSVAFGLEKGKVSDPIRVPRGWALLTVREAHPSRLPELAEAEAKVREAIARERGAAEATAQAQTARAALGAGKSLDDVAKGFGLEAHDSGEFGLTGFITGLGMDLQVNQAAFKLKAGEFGGPVPSPQGPVLFQVTERMGFDPAEFAKQKDQIRDGLVRDAVNKLLAALVEQRRQELKVTYDRTLLQQFGILDEENKAKS
jgi:peptidyl-prolyl cis-trans isomerase D